MLQIAAFRNERRPAWRLVRRARRFRKDHKTRHSQWLRAEPGWRAHTWPIPALRIGSTLHLYMHAVPATEIQL